PAAAPAISKAAATYLCSLTSETAAAPLATVASTPSARSAGGGATMAATDAIVATAAGLRLAQLTSDTPNLTSSTLGSNFASSFTPLAMNTPALLTTCSVVFKT